MIYETGVWFTNVIDAQQILLFKLKNTIRYLKTKFRYASNMRLGAYFAAVVLELQDQ